MKILPITNQLNNQPTLNRVQNKYSSNINQRNELPKGIDSKFFSNISFKGEKEFLEASKNGDLDAVIRELNNGVNINAKNEYKHSKF